MRKSKIKNNKRPDAAAKRVKIKVYTPEGTPCSQLVRQAIADEDGMNYWRAVNKFVKENKKLTVGSTVVFATVEMIVKQVNSRCIKLTVK